MSTKPGEFQIDLSTADEFLTAIAPTHHMWRDNGWVFRGQGDARWGLVPSVLRIPTEGETPRWKMKGLVEGIGSTDPEQLKILQRLQGESRLVLNFRNLADRVGLAIPEDSARMRSWRQIEAIIGASPMAAFGAGMSATPPRRWPQSELLSAVALAQHYGVPTRLLDWSWKPRVAAYFAARDAVRAKLTGSLVVWALRVQVLDYLWAGQVDDPDVESVHAPQASNPNLSAQAGLFTVARHVHEEVKFENVLVDKANEVRIPIETFIRKLTLPTSQARGLMARLAYENVSAATVFPGYGGVVEALNETEWWAETD